ncbi:hypothetical protein NDU88_009295 [Pleurodeles waltl]|uniref:Uncharacterized protein n=1 Tax=Pleurodeles waltl TaxID=8319 RepID=A0AAV7PS26_PLEWA|nr:hypothetical protein NDU88_009295 [Pleurodeles waltl]
MSCESARLPPAVWSSIRHFLWAIKAHTHPMWELDIGYQSLEPRRQQGALRNCEECAEVWFQEWQQFLQP